MRNEKALLENKREILGNKIALIENKRAILGIKGHFWEVKGHIELKTRALAASLSPPLNWSFLDVSIKKKFKNFSNRTFFQWVRYTDLLIP